MGDMSYPIYVFHFPLSILIVQTFKHVNFYGLLLLNLLSVIPLQYIFETKAKPCSGNL